VLPVDDLMSLAQASTERSLTNDECRPFIDETTMLEDYGCHLVSLVRIGDDGAWPSDTAAEAAVRTYSFALQVNVSRLATRVRAARSSAGWV
jgi:hypothetical protein